MPYKINILCLFCDPENIDAVRFVNCVTRWRTISYFTILRQSKIIREFGRTDIDSDIWILTELWVDNPILQGKAQPEHYQRLPN